MRALGREADAEGRVYFTGGASAVLVGWRDSTVDVDLKLAPETDRLFRAIAALKESLQLNVELASPADFIPELPGWEDRSPFIDREGRLSFHHYDFHAQALAKVERGHAQDVADVRALVARGLITPERLRAFFEEIAGRLDRYPAVDPRSFRRALEELLASP
jgi:uncharacterized protein (DUF2336 family)